MIIIIGDGMICPISTEDKAMKKKAKKWRKIIMNTDNFVIVNSTSNPQVRDLPHVMSDIIRDENSMAMPMLSSINALAYQMPAAIFDEGCPEKRKQQILQTFLISPDFSTETMNICAYQYSHKEANMLIVIEQEMYNRYLKDMVERMLELIVTTIARDRNEERSLYNQLRGNLIFTWNSVPEMADHLKYQVQKQIDAFDMEKWERERDEYEIFDSLEEDDYDRYLDAKQVADTLCSCKNNDIREMFLSNARYDDYQNDILRAFVRKCE